ncbi:MAG: T9SS type A sorting domain-containing protein [Saprospiraceae bacterium]|nr:T9SS type A sorting domain-containing protein [Candidatus Opimibacter iunctus]
MKKIAFNLILLHTLCFVLTTLSAQPVNDDCSGAFEVVVGESEASAVLTEGDSRGATASLTPVSVCSSLWYTDDTWYRFRTPVDLPSDEIILKVFFDNLIRPMDVSAIGMAIYVNCDTETTALRCFSSDVPEENSFELLDVCILADHEYYVRIWSTGSDTSTEGTFRVGVFNKTASEPFLWWETFGGGLEANGWTTFGSCSPPDSNANAGWKYLPTGLVDGGEFIFAGAAINSATVCDGAVGVDSDFNNHCGDFCNGPCPSPGHHELISPPIYSGAWNVAGLSLTWTQAIRQFQSSYFFAYRMRDDDSEWSDWIEQEINTEYVINGYFLNLEIQRFPLPGAVGHDSLQLRFTYNDNYYLWAIDDVMIIAQECNNSMISNFYAIPPFAQIPANQVYPFPALANVYNTGACPITNTALRCTVVDQQTLDTIYNETVDFGSIDPGPAIENRIFPKLIDLPGYSTDYRLTYSLTQDSLDFDPLDNQVSILFSTGGNVFALEDVATRSVAISRGLYDQGAPLSYAYGNYFRPKETRAIQRIIWGVNNPAEMAGKTVQLYLLQWSDNNHNQIAEFSERKYVGYNEYTFEGNEGDNVEFETTLESFENPGDIVKIQGGLGYMVIVEYQAQDENDPQLFIRASEARDYTGIQLASDTAFANGMIDMPYYFSVLGFSPDGNLTNIDYEVKELDINDDRIFFGNDIVPLVRIITGHLDTMINTKDILPASEKIEVFPNPAKAVINVKMDFTIQPQVVDLKLINSLGQIVLIRSFTLLSQNQIEIFDVSNLVAGSYHLQVETSEGQRTIPVAILH